MLIRCPTCASGYDLAPALLSGGRILRCAHCRDAWVHRAGFGDRDGPEIVAEASASRLSAAEPRRPARPTPRAPRWPSWPSWSSRPSSLLRPSRSLRGSVPSARLPWARPTAGASASLLAAALLAGGGAVLACRTGVVARFPPSEAVFATLGLPVNLSGLAFGELHSTVAGSDRAATLTLEGRIINLAPNATAVPALRIAVRDKDRRELYHWTAPAPKARLAAGETVPFRGELIAPPRDGQDLAVSFAEPTPDRRRVVEAMASDR